MSSTVADAIAGDEAAFTQLVALHDDDLVRVAYLVTGDVTLARDAAQSAWALAWRRLGGLRDHERIRPWLVAITVNEARQFLRRRRRTAIREIAVSVFDDELAGPRVVGRSSAGPEDAVRSLDLAGALRRLSEEDRAMVAMRYAIGLTSEEIGVALRMPPGTVRSRLARSRAQLRKDLGDAYA